MLDRLVIHPLAIALVLVGLVLVLLWLRTGDHRLLAGVGLAAGLAFLDLQNLLQEEPYPFLSGIALVLCVLWLRSDERWMRHGFLAAVGLLLLYFAFDRVRPESAARQMQRKTEAMAAAVAARDVNAILTHVSDQFQVGNHDKAGLGQLAQQTLDNGDLTELLVWSFDNAQVGEASASIDFKVKARGHRGEKFFRCTATFIKDADEEWRLREFRLLDGINGQVIPLLGY